ncbi:hypothetical protein EI42_01358 [Thermosporothrix hazakensis]|jgi:hypothetical protein|uniref:DUF6036 domain-containing protein n=2 Tax=Thermosporothrix TaxID=768650 RepID=A0A326UBE5_THEHA|nr:DUF6036 family nucleotidyltransferase [Thermosporothrix hazakensis]PZW34521.1 hypothetical protein EI42_01358 [Thermosporothrix hazakensis]BBH85644.1 hypothetical protein KTC_03950 [Thermosporothrix sp. COM3]GCE45927.1 hypothetical protein KTH_07960 [Thermosporothrix hazakensis]
MESQDIERYFIALGEELERSPLQEPVRVLVVGGGYMLLIVKNRKSTEDVDVVLMDLPDTTNPTPEAKAFKAAVRAVAGRFKLKRRWLNDDVAYFIRDMAPDPQATLWRKYGKLHIYLPAKEYILALKLMVFRQKDMSDVEALLQELDVTTREQAQAIVDRFVPDPRWQEEYLLEETLDTLFD